IHWRRVIRSADRAWKYLPPGALVEVSFEELVLEPEDTLKRLCAFLDLPFDPMMLDYGANLESLTEGMRGLEDVHQVLLSGKIEPRKSRQAQTTLTEGMVQTAWAIVGRRAAEFGYRPSGEIQWSRQSQL